jgi:hypothetical protein
VPPGFAFRVDAWRNLVVTPAAAARRPRT